MDANLVLVSNCDVRKSPVLQRQYHPSPSATVTPLKGGGVVSSSCFANVELAYLKHGQVVFLYF